MTLNDCIAYDEENGNVWFQVEYDGIVYLYNAFKDTMHESDGTRLHIEDCWEVEDLDTWETY